MSAMAEPGFHGKDKQRCGARVRSRCGFCRKWPVPGTERCRWHGGLSTGARTPEGKARSIAAMREGRQRWLDLMHARKEAGEIDRFPAGRKSGTRWVTAQMWERKVIAESQELQAEIARRSPSPQPKRRGRPSKEDLALREKVRDAAPRPSAALERLLQLVDRTERRLTLVETTNQSSFKSRQAST